MEDLREPDEPWGHAKLADCVSETRAVQETNTLVPECLVISAIVEGGGDGRQS